MKKTFWLLVFSLAWLVIAVPGAHAQRPFTNGAVRGPYGFSFDGTAALGAPVVAEGRLIADGQGGISGGQRTLIIGAGVGVSLILHQTFACNYIVSETGTGNANCTGITPPNPDGTTMETFDFVLVANGKEVHFVSTVPGDVIRGVATQQ